MAKKRGRPREKKRQEIIVRARLRTDNDPQLQRFAELLAAAPNASDVIRDALRLYALYQDGALALPDDVVTEDDLVVAIVDQDINVEDIFGF